MGRVIIFSQFFPKEHYKCGEKTFFIEQILNGFGVEYNSVDYLSKLYWLNRDKLADPTHPLTEKMVKDFWKKNLIQKHPGRKGHTIRAGNRFEVGDWFSPRCWIGLPYQSPQLIFWHDSKVFEQYEFKRTSLFYLKGQQISDIETIERIATNDGLKRQEFYGWFNKPMEGQIICFDENIKY